MNPIDNELFTLTAPVWVWQVIYRHLEMGRHCDIKEALGIVLSQLEPQYTELANRLAAEAAKQLTAANTNAEKATQPPVLN